MKHRVSLEARTLDIARAGSAITLEIYAGEGEEDSMPKIGHIEIGRGSFRWKLDKKQDFEVLSWEKLFRILKKARDE